MGLPACLLPLLGTVPACRSLRRLGLLEAEEEEVNEHPVCKKYWWCAGLPCEWSWESVCHTCTEHGNYKRDKKEKMKEDIPSHFKMRQACHYCPTCKLHWYCEELGKGKCPVYPFVSICYSCWLTEH